jgi:hypothetical protein
MANKIGKLNGMAEDEINKRIELILELLEKHDLKLSQTSKKIKEIDEKLDNIDNERR